MKSLYKYFLECDTATPGNTTGAGNPIAPDLSEIPGMTGGNDGSGDTFTAKRRRKRRSKDIHIKDENEYRKNIGEGSLTGVIEGLFDDDYNISVPKMWKHVKNEFEKKIGFGRSNHVDFFMDNLPFIEEYCKTHKVKPKYSTDICAVDADLTSKSLEIKCLTSRGDLKTYTWFAFGNKVMYTCQVNYNNGADEWAELCTYRNRFVFVKTSEMNGII